MHGGELPEQMGRPEHTSSDESMSAKFLVEDTLMITGRGLIIVGQILEGTLWIGSRVLLPDGTGGSKIEPVTGLESGHGRNEDGTVRGFVGLLIGRMEESEIPEMRKRLVRGDELNVMGPEPDR